jgi:uncharacterized membrane protein YdbT with pleckstrin-like domain
MTIIKRSQWVNIGWILFGIAGIAFIIPPIIAAYKMLEVYTWTYTIDKHRIIEKKGVFSVNHLETNLYRIKSFRFDEPFLMRMVGIGNLYIKSSNPYQPELKMIGIQKGEELWKQLRIKTLDNRQQFGVKEYDLFNL